MPLLSRPGKPTLHYRIDDFTDPWTNAAVIVLQHGYVSAEMRVLEGCGKPALVLLNQLGPPRPAADEQADVERWHSHLQSSRRVHGVLAFDAFARCWVQVAVPFGELSEVILPDKRDVFARLNTQWLHQRQATFDTSMQILAERLKRAALDRESLADSCWTDKLLALAIKLSLRRDDRDSPRQLAMCALAERLDSPIRSSSERLIELPGLGGHATTEILSRLANHYAVREPLSESKSAALGGVITGAVAGLKTDLASGGMTFGAGLLVGSVLGALGSAGLARGYNLVRGAKVTTIAWTDEVLDDLAVSALLGYLAVAHYGRGRGDWAKSESPAHWQVAVAEAFMQQQPAFCKAWSLRTDANATEVIMPVLHNVLAATARTVLMRLYPDVQIDFGQSLSAAPRAVSASNTSRERVCADSAWRTSRNGSCPAFWYCASACCSRALTASISPNNLPPWNIGCASPNASCQISAGPQSRSPCAPRHRAEIWRNARASRSPVRMMRRW